MISRLVIGLKADSPLPVARDRTVVDSFPDIMRHLGAISVIQDRQ